MGIWKYGNIEICVTGVWKYELWEYRSMSDVE